MARERQREGEHKRSSNGNSNSKDQTNSNKYTTTGSTIVCSLEREREKKHTQKANFCWMKLQTFMHKLSLVKRLHVYEGEYCTIVEFICIRPNGKKIGRFIVAGIMQYCWTRRRWRRGRGGWIGPTSPVAISIEQQQLNIQLGLLAVTIKKIQTEIEIPSIISCAFVIIPCFIRQHK